MRQPRLTKSIFSSKGWRSLFFSIHTIINHRSSHLASEYGQKGKSRTFNYNFFIFFIYSCSISQAEFYTWYNCIIKKSRVVIYGDGYCLFCKFILLWQFTFSFARLREPPFLRIYFIFPEIGEYMITQIVFF